jgi:hypothetical protein
MIEGRYASDIVMSILDYEHQEMASNDPEFGEQGF